MIDLAAKMISDGQGNELMPREADNCAPITAYRYALLRSSGFLDALTYLSLPIVMFYLPYSTSIAVSSGTVQVYSANCIAQEVSLLL